MPQPEPVAPLTIEDQEAGYTDAAMKIGSYESLGQKAYWDVNAWRLGYGSDTEGQDQFTVVQGMPTTQARAEANLRLRIKEYEATVIKQVGQDAYARLSRAQRTSLLSVAYNYGSLPGSVRRAVVRGDVGDIGDSIRSLKANVDRRKDEASAFPRPAPVRHAVPASNHFRSASVHHAITSALALGPGTYAATHRHSHKGG